MGSSSNWCVCVCVWVTPRILQYWQMPTSPVPLSPDTVLSSSEQTVGPLPLLLVLYTVCVPGSAGHGIPVLLKAVTKLMPLDSYVPSPVEWNCVTFVLISIHCIR